MSEVLHPSAPYLLGLVLVVLAPAPVARATLLLAPAAAVAIAWTLPDGARATASVMSLQLTWIHVDALGRVFAIIFALFGGLGALFALPFPSPRLHAAAFGATAAAIGIALAGDWPTLYVAWESLAVASFVLILDGRTRRAAAGALHYLIVHITGGALLLAGIAWQVGQGGSLAVGPLELAGPAILILLGFAVNAAIPPLNAWLTDAYPESSPAGTVFLSAFATKSAVYALARVFPGTELLVWAGSAMALYGVLFATLQNDIRRLLGYHIVSQVGYMVTGVGLGTPLSVNGAVAHAFCHILYKGLLLMGAGTVLHATGRRRLTDLGQLAGAMPATLVLYMVGALSISAAPLLNGFVSKSMVIAAAEKEHWTVVAWLLHLASVGTFLSVGLKLPYYTFFGDHRGPAPRPVPAPMLGAMTLTAALCVLIGIAPDTLYRLLPFPVDYAPYTAGHVFESLQILAGTAVGFVLLARYLHGEPRVTLDTDRLYRPAAAWLAQRAAPALSRVADSLEAGAERAVTLPMAEFPRVMAGRLGSAVFIALVMVGAVLAVLTLLG